jgi:mRNA interferase RelE/StbE
MPHTIEFKPSARRQFDKLDRQMKRRIGAAIDSLFIYPLPRAVEKLQGEEATFRIRVGAYRVLYEIEGSRLLVPVLRIGHRREVYR